MSTDLQIVVSEKQGAVPVSVFQLKGEITSSNYEQLQAQVTEAFEAGMTHLILDFSELTFMSSAGLRAIHSIYKMLEGEEGAVNPEGVEKSTKFKLLNVPDQIRRTINVIGFDRYVTMYSDLEEALASF